MPFGLWHALASVAEILPEPPITRNQVELMQLDSVASPGAPGFGDLGISSTSLEDALPAIVGLSGGTLPRATCPVEQSAPTGARVRSRRFRPMTRELVVHRGLGVLHHPGDRVGDVLDIGWLQLRLAARPNRGKTGRRRNILAIGIRKASPRPNITEGRMSVVAGKASRTAFSPFPRLRIYGEADPASAPMPDTWINRPTPASRASRATRVAAST